MLYAKLHAVYLGLHIYSLSKLDPCTAFIINRPLGLQHISTRTLQHFCYAHLLNSVEIKLFDLIL